MSWWFFSNHYSTKGGLIIQGNDLKLSFERDGYVCIRKLIPMEYIEGIRAEISRVQSDAVFSDRNNLRCRYKINPGNGQQILDALDPVADILPGVRAITELASVVSLLSNLYGDTPRLFKDKIILKPAGAPGYPWHQDFISWPFFPESFLTLVAPLDSATEENGCIELVRGSHKDGYLSARDGDFHDLPETHIALQDRVQIPLEPGDVLIFGCFTVHGSGPNRSDRERRQLYLSFNSDNDGGDQREAHYRFFHSWLRRRYEEYGTKDAFFK